MGKGLVRGILVGVTCGVALAVPACTADVGCSETGTCSSPAADGGFDATEEANDANSPSEAPVIAAIDTALGDTAGGTPITIRGERFLGATGATLGGVPLTTFLVANDREITAVTGPHAKGVVDLIVTKETATAKAEGVFEYFNPTSIAGCVWWLRADLGVITTDGEVTAWADQSGVGDSGRDAVPVGDRPAWNAKDPKYNNKATVGTFNKAGAANNCRLRTKVWKDIYSAPGGTKAITLGLVGHADTSSIRYFVFATNTDYIALAGANALPSVYAGNGNVILQNAAATVTDIPKTLLMAEFNGASSKLYVNATVTASVTGDLGTATTLGDEPMHVGSYITTATTYGVERVAEVYAYGRVLTDAEKAKLRSYLNLRYDKTMTE